MRSSRNAVICVVALLAATSAQVSRAAASSEVANAAMADNKADVRSLLAKKADVNVQQADGATAIQWAVRNNDLELTDLLIAAGANVKTPNHYGATALSLACISGNAAMIGKLLKAGADPNEQLPQGETALMMASRTGAVDAMKVLLEHGANVNAKETLRGTTALMWAAEQGHADAVRLLIEHGADANAASAAIVQKGARPNLGATVTRPPGGVRPPAAPADKVKIAAAPAIVANTGTEGDNAAAAANAGAAFLQVGKVGGMTALDYAAREDDLDCAQILVEEAKANVNQVTVDGWSPLLLATQNRNYKLAEYLLKHGANPNIASSGGWTPLYLAINNRNIEGGEYPVHQGDMDHLDFIKLLIANGADVNARIKDHTETRTNFTQQWLNEDGATAFLRATMSGDVALMKLLLANGADPKIKTRNNTNALAVASGIGWVEGITYEWSPEQSLEAVKICLDLGLDINNVDNDGRTALDGAAHKGRNEVVQLLVDHGAKMDIEDKGSALDTARNGKLNEGARGWMAVDYADGLVRVGVQSAIPHPETAALLRKLMTEKGIAIPPPNTISICVTDVCK
jgi:ankyrin repeat protein